MSPRIIKDVTSIFSCNFKDYEAEVQTLEKIKAHDEYTYLHCLNVARLSVALGRKLGLSDDHLVNLGWSALLHDIGKLSVPLSVLNKLKKFTPEELSIMQSHPLQSLIAFAKTTPVTLDRLQRLSAAFEHHQRYDLQGYPVVQTKLTLHPFSRIVAIADTFDAMTTDRIYQRRILPDVALKLMAQGFGTIFDPVVLQAFITSMGAYPVGTLVRISFDKAERLAVVTHYGNHSLMDRPMVYLVNGSDLLEASLDKSDPSPNKLAPSIDLMDPSYRHLKILRSEFPEDHQISVEEVLHNARKDLKAS